MKARRIQVRASLALAALAACGGGKAAERRIEQPAQPPGGHGAAAGAPAPGAPVPALPGGGERAYVADATGLVEVSTAGGSQVVAPAASWCNVDARANVVWFVNAGGLQAFDLADRRTRTIIAGDLADLEVIIDWGEQQLGGESAVEFDIAAAVQMTDKPTIQIEMGCDGDRAAYCYEDDGETLAPEAEELRRRVATLALADPAHVASLARRGKQGSLWSPPPMPPGEPKHKPALDRRRCTEDPSRCGELTALPGSPLWLVHTANSRGDYYHETRELWDPATGEYVRRDGARLVRSKRPAPAGAPGTDHGGMRISTSGVLSFEGAVFDGGKVHHAPQASHGSPISCGWAGGGWRIAGPTDG